ncbi:MAG TPA: threonine synthase [Gillisia sp.]|nr:threonine synthase [Gillisia sp.]
MKYFSLNNHSHFANFETAVINGIAPDKGLYFPEKVEKLKKDFFENLSSLSKIEIALEVIKPYVGGEIPVAHLADIVEKTLDFEFPVVPVEENICALELFHGPTLAFKDVGARFMAGCLGYFVKKGNVGEVTVLVATSGDTGGAVANGFLGVEGIKVVILYPKGKVSDFQERQLTTLSKNITAMEVEGTFDNCQAMVKKAFHDEEVKRKRKLTSANSINVARWLPQMFYYFLGYRQVQQKGKKQVFSVPSGNFGNICAGLLAREMGLPIDHFIASTNSNKVVTDYLKSGNYEPAPSVATLSNAMDVGDPSNFARILELFQNEYKTVKTNLSSYSFDDTATLKAMKDVYSASGYILDPHGAVGYLGLKTFLAENEGFYGTFLETAHPVKFADTVEKATGIKPEMPEGVKDIMSMEKRKIPVRNYEDLKEYLVG